ncbi:MAG: DUF2911 domain-containing protein [Bacteroidota bacterium]
MLKTYLFPLALLLLLVTACEDTARTAEDVVEETTDAAQTAIPQVTEEVAEMVDQGDLPYEVKVIDDKIKSQRKELVGEVNGIPLTINYGSPAVNDRIIYGDLVPFEKVWRTGANEATRITFTEDVIVGTDKKELAAGTYSLFTLPNSKDDWTIIFNKTANQWGAYDYEESQDAARAHGVASPAKAKAERMDFAIDEDSVKLMWDDLVVAFPVTKVSK